MWDAFHTATTAGKWCKNMQTLGWFLFWFATLEAVRKANVAGSVPIWFHPGSCGTNCTNSSLKIKSGTAILNPRRISFWKLTDPGENYMAIMTAVLEQLQAGRSPTSLLGHFDAPKLASSVQLFDTWRKNVGKLGYKLLQRHGWILCRCHIWSSRKF